MSTSKVRRRRVASAPRGDTSPMNNSRKGDTQYFALPATVSRAALLKGGSDRRFRQLIYDLLTIAVRMDTVREYLGRQIEISGPQYSILVAVAQFQGSNGVSVGTLAKTLHVSSAFIAMETGRLARFGLLLKRPNPKDGRGVLLSLTLTSRHQIELLSSDIRTINDLFFSPLNGRAFNAFSSVSAALVQSSRKAMHRLRMLTEEDAILREAAE